MRERVRGERRCASAKMRECASKCAHVRSQSLKDSARFLSVRVQKCKGEASGCKSAWACQCARAHVCGCARVHGRTSVCVACWGAACERVTAKAHTEDFCADLPMTWLRNQ